MAGEIGDYCGIDFIGGGIGAVDKIDGAVLQDKDHFLVVTPTVFAPLSLDADSGAGENSPQFIAPNTNPGNKRWILVGGVFAGLISYGNVGINTPTPNAPLEVKGANPGVVGGFQSGHLQVTNSSTAQFSNAVITGHNSFNTNTQLWYLGNESGGNNDVGFINRQNGAMHFNTNNATRVTIGADGKVGINIAAPADWLHIYEASDSGWSGRGAFSGQTNAAVIGTYSGVATVGAHNAALIAWADLHINHDGATNIGLVCKTDGKVGVNDLLPASQFDVNGDINTTDVYKVDDTQVVSNQGAAVANATDAATTMARLNDLLARCRAHGLIAT